MQEPGSQFLHERTPNLRTAVAVESLAGRLVVNGGLISDRAVAIGRLAAMAAELPNILEFDVQQLESERKMNTMENLRALQKRFGERFVKGELMEGGGYTGSGARELLADFMELAPRKFPGAGFVDNEGNDREVSFAEVLKRIIPNKHGAYTLLKDNHAYIQATLEQWYKDDPDHERAPVRDPYELARSVGYELTGPFGSTSEFVGLDKQDFRANERICTFNDPTGRLRGYHILWLRRDDVSGTLPADQLTADTLSDTWKTYLKTIGRYDRDSDSYDLSGLRPTRDDPYGTSSMSVQISRTGSHVSIKNRYNHTVGNPDNTLDSDLDNVAYGLKRAVYSRIGREDLMDKTSVALAEGYIADNKGGIHHYQYEEDNVHYGDYEYISNGVVTSIDRGKYYMISPQLYVPKSGKGDELRLGQRCTAPRGLEVSSDVRFLYNSGIKGKEKDPVLAELRRAYAERDHSELKARTTEFIREQVGSAYVAYRTVADKLLGTQRGFLSESEVAASVQELEQLFATKDQEWQANGVYDYLVEKLITDGARFNLVATPNVEASEAQVVALAEAFGKDQPYQTYVYDDLYRKGRYTGKEWSGNRGSAPIRLSLIPSRYDGEMGYGTVETQTGQLRERRVKQPKLDAHVPSLLEAVTYWYSLRAQGDKLSDGSTFDKTYIRHFDLDPKTVGGWRVVPDSCVRDGGGPRLGGSYADYGRDVRLAVG